MQFLGGPKIKIFKVPQEVKRETPLNQQQKLDQMKAIILGVPTNVTK